MSNINTNVMSIADRQELAALRAENAALRSKQTGPVALKLGPTKNPDMTNVHMAGVGGFNLSNKALLGLLGNLDKFGPAADAFIKSEQFGKAKAQTEVTPSTKPIYMGYV